MRNEKGNLGFFECWIFGFLMLTTLVSLYLSYYMELVVYRSIFNGIDYAIFYGITITVIFAATFNAAKLGVTWVLAHLKNMGGNRLWAVMLRSVLVINSLLMTVFIVTGQFTAPNAQDVYNKKLDQIEERYRDRERSAERNHQSAQYQIKRSYELEIAETKGFYQPDLDKAEKGMTTEMGNVINGIWKGDKYQEWKEKSMFTKEKMDQALLQAQERYRKALVEQNDKFEQKQERIADDKQVALDDENLEKYLDNYESQNRHVTALIGLINKVSKKSSVGPHHIILLVALLLTAIIEFVPLLLGSYLFTQYLQMKQARTMSFSNNCLPQDHSESGEQKNAEKKVVRLADQVNG